MKNDIDSILDSMLRDGKLNFGAAKRRNEQTQQALESVQETGDSLSRSLQSSIAQLTQEAKADMQALDQRLQADGLKKDVPAGNSGNPEQTDAAFQTAEEETARKVLGQKEFVSAVALAFRRPFVAGFRKEMPMGRIAVLGKPGTGRHSAVEAMTASLARQGVLKSPKTTALDLSRYGDSSSEKLIAQDVYTALKSGSSAILFEQYEKCGTAVLSMLSELFRTGSIPLAGRYAEQKGMLVEIGSALVPGAVSSLSASGKYLFLLTDRSLDKLANDFGAPFLAALDDICETGEFSQDSLREIAGRMLKLFCERTEKQLRFTFTYDTPAAEALAAFYRPDRGIAAMEEYTDALYRSLSEYKLKQKVQRASGKIIVENGQLMLSGEEEAFAFRIGVFAPKAAEGAVEAVKKELSEIVGLQTVKEYVLSLEDNFKMQQLRKEKGLKADSPSMHMIFTGNPGTGKTTVARIVSRYLKAIGVLAGGQLVEVTRADLVGKYVGHTAPLTQKAIQSALGGVLFIDEAYSLSRGKDDSFGLEAIDTLVKGMEDHREDLVVILAGYSREMEDFLKANSGLRSRFPNMIEFPDYTARELLEITKSIVKGKGYRLDPSCEEPLLSYYEQKQQGEEARTGGNGRMVRNKVEEAVIACSRRNVREPEEKRDLELLLPQDFGFPALPGEEEG